MLDEIGQRGEQHRRRRMGLGTIVALGLCGFVAIAVAAGGTAADLAFPPPVSVEGSAAPPADTTTTTAGEASSAEPEPADSLPAPPRPQEGDGGLQPLDEEAVAAATSAPTTSTTAEPGDDPRGPVTTAPPRPTTSRAGSPPSSPTTRPPSTRPTAAPTTAAPGPSGPTLAVRPATDLVHDQPVDVSGTGYAAGSSQVLEVCSLSGCQRLSAPVVVDARGRLRSRLRIPRIVYPGPQPVDCAGTPHVCVMRVVPGGRSVTASVAFDASAPKPAAPTFSAAPTEGLEGGSTIQARVGGIPAALAGEWLLRQCAADEADRPFGLDPCPTATSGAEGSTATATVRVERTVAGRSGPIDCASAPGRCSLELVIGNSVVAKVALSFAAPAPTTTASATEPTAAPAGLTDRASSIAAPRLRPPA